MAILLSDPKGISFALFTLFLKKHSLFRFSTSAILSKSGHPAGLIQKREGNRGCGGGGRVRGWGVICLGDEQHLLRLQLSKKSSQRHLVRQFYIIAMKTKSARQAIVLSQNKCRIYDSCLQSRFQPCPYRGESHDQNQDLLDLSTCLLSSSFDLIKCRESSIAATFTRLPANVAEMRFVRLILKSNGLAFCALFVCTLKSRIYVEGFVT